MGLVTDFGTVQSNIGQLLNASTELLWVNAQKDSQASNSYKYEGEAPHTYHVPGPNFQQGDCLTYSSDANGDLVTMVSKKVKTLHLSITSLSIKGGLKKLIPSFAGRRLW